ncbi:MAG: hypothetical protein WCW03_03055 [Candidatus Paceibacterota bacterium]|jgi:hypothetical protein
MDALTAIFGSQTKIKLLRMFLFNEQTPFFLAEIITRVRCAKSAVQKELNILVKAGLIKKKNAIKEVEIQKGKKLLYKKLKGSAYLLNEKFTYHESLKNLLTIVSIQADESLARRFASVGKVKLIIAAGVFIQNWDSRVDLLIVGEELNLNKIESIIKIIESEIGKEIAYSAFETQDFEYRLGIHDRLVRDILDYPHITLLDRIGIETN